MHICLEEQDYYGCIAILHKKILASRTKSSIIEYVTRDILNGFPDPCQIPFCDKITKLNEEGSSVVTGTALQMRLETDLEESIEKCIEYARLGDDLSHCDQLSERVLGFAILNYPEIIVPVLPALLKEDERWIVRMVGVGSCHAVKNGLAAEFVEELFNLLVANSDRTDADDKEGIGWAAKSTAELHPEIVSKYWNYIDTDPNVGAWFRTEVETGLAGSERNVG